MASKEERIAQIKKAIADKIASEDIALSVVAELPDGFDYGIISVHDPKLFPVKERIKCQTTVVVNVDTRQDVQKVFEQFDVIPMCYRKDGTTSSLIAFEELTEKEKQRAEDDESSLVVYQDIAPFYWHLSSIRSQGRITDYEYVRFFAHLPIITISPETKLYELVTVRLKIQVEIKNIEVEHDFYTAGQKAGQSYNYFKQIDKRGRVDLIKGAPNSGDEIVWWSSPDQPSDRSRYWFSAYSIDEPQDVFNRVEGE